MAQTWEVLRARVIRALDDEDRTNPTWGDEELVDYLSFGLEALASHTAAEVVWLFTPEEETEIVELPEDVLQVGAVWFPDRQILSRLDLQPGTNFSDTTVTSSSYPLAYYEWPQGVLNLTRSLGSGKELTVFYWGYWQLPEQPADPLETPRWASEALYWYILGRALTKDGISQAKLGQWHTKQDSGRPEDNPLRIHARWCEDQYLQILADHPSQDRTRWGGA